MLAVISPAKTLDFESPPTISSYSQPEHLEAAAELVAVLRCMAPHELSGLMSISDQLGLLNHERYQNWSLPFTPDNARQALLAFKGDVYTGLNAGAFSAADFDHAQRHLRILSGLYGVLRPLDLMQAYRLEMGTRLATAAGANLYQFWGDRITRALNDSIELSGSEVLINLASGEYFKSVRTRALKARLIVPVFKERREGGYRIISFSAKRARGLMAAFMIRQRLQTPEGLLDFAEEGYRFNPGLSDQRQWVFTRESPC